MKIRVLHVVSIMNRGGIETLLMNIYRKIDREKVQFDFLCNKEEKGVFEEEIKRLGGKIYKIPSISTVGYLKHKKAFEEILRQHPEYKIIHCHMNTWSGLYLPIARKVGVKIRIAHSHTSKFGKGGSIEDKIKILFKKYHRLFIPYGATKYYACSNSAGVHLFGKKNMDKKVEVIKNGIDVESFMYNENIRLNKRKELAVDTDTVLLGHVGRFNPVKNHEEIINIFSQVSKKIPNIKLCLVGDGQLREKIKQKATQLGIENQIIFLGVRSDINELMMAFDLLLFPSLYEGLPVTLIEAQVSGLPIITSDTVTREVDLGLGLVDFLPLNNTMIWRDYILNKINRSMELRETNLSKIQNTGYDIQHTVEYLQKFYIEAYR